MTENRRIGWPARVATYLLAALFLFQGVYKLMGNGVDDFAVAGYAPWFLYLIGALETGAGAGFLFRPARRMAALVVCVIMVGAIYTNTVRVPEMAVTVPVPIVTLGLAAFVYRRESAAQGKSLTEL